MVSSEEGSDAVWRTFLSVKPFSQYMLSAWMKTENVVPLTVKGVFLTLHTRPGDETTPLTGTNDWTLIEMVFDSGTDDTIQINCVLGFKGLVRGTVWFDDIRLKFISSQILKQTVAIGAEKTADPISKYIYGQFIEHVGRTIYGGLWSGMLKDRKFYRAPGDSSSWKVSGKSLEETVWLQKKNIRDTL